MNDYIMISDYMNIDKYRISFNKLAMNTFGLDFEDWYEKGLFYGRYICYSYIYEEQVIANASINEMDLVVDGQKRKAIQIGTVMTHPGHRKQGLAASLIKHIIEKHKGEYDIIYLFANDSVLDFYPKFGFKKAIENAYDLDVIQVQKKAAMIKKLNKDNKEDYEIIMRLGVNRQPISQRLGIYNDIWPLLVYCFYQYKEDLYYLVEEDIVVIAVREDGILHIYDILSLKPIDLDNIIEKIIMPNDRKIEFHFVPELCRYSIASSLKERPDDTLFVNSKNISLKEILFPMTSHT